MGFGFTAFEICSPDFGKCIKLLVCIAYVKTTYFLVTIMINRDSLYENYVTNKWW